MIPHYCIIMNLWLLIISSFRKKALKDSNLRWFLSSYKHCYSWFILAVTFSQTDGAQRPLVVIALWEGHK